MTTKAKADRPAKFDPEKNLSAEQREMLAMIARVVRQFREIDPDYMTASRIELFLNTILHPARSLRGHARELDMLELNALRNGSVWGALNVRGDPGYGHMVEGERPETEATDETDTMGRLYGRRTMRRKHMALNAKGVALVEKILRAAKG